jgi:hypothetical protein
LIFLNALALARPASSFRQEYRAQGDGLAGQLVDHAEGHPVVGAFNGVCPLEVFLIVV